MHTSFALRFPRRSVGVGLAALLVTALGCGGDAPTSVVTGRVFDAKSLEPLAGVTVSAGDRTATTNAEGEYSIAVRRGRESTIKIESNDHAGASQAVRASGSKEAYVETRLVPFSGSSSFGASAGGAVASGDAKVSVPANSLADGNGVGASGMIDVRVAVIDPRQPNDLRAAPAALVARNASGGKSALSGAAFVDITASQQGRRLGVANGQKLTVDFPANGRTAQSISLYSLDRETGAWKHEGTATKTDVGNGKHVYRAEISHLSWWGIAEEVTTTCVSLCATIAGAPASDAWVSAEGVGEGLLVSGLTDENGCFSAEVPLGRSFRLVVYGVDGYVETAFDAPAEASATCFALSSIELTPHAQDTWQGPIGSETCGSDFIDVSFDPSNCGGCGIACAIDEACIDSVCTSFGCAPPLAPCGDVCTVGGCVACTADSGCAPGEQCDDPDFDGIGACATAVGPASSMAFWDAFRNAVTADCTCWALDPSYVDQADCLATNIGTGLSPNLTVGMVDTCRLSLGELYTGVDWNAVIDCSTRFASEIDACIVADGACGRNVESCMPIVRARMDLCGPYVDQYMNIALECLALPDFTACTANGECQSGYCEPGMGMCMMPAPVDADLDGTFDDVDNCLGLANAQWNHDGDTFGDACDDDDDNDGVLDVNDGCPYAYDPAQTETYPATAMPNACDYLDTDGDGAPDWYDNCVAVYNPGQSNIDADLDGDACETDNDYDNDGVSNSVDTCPAIPNPGAGQTDDSNLNSLVDACEFAAPDVDGDLITDAVDTCPSAYDASDSNLDGTAPSDICDDDDDDDTVLDVADNCPRIATTLGDQTDSDTDGFGDACDGDDDADGIDDADDNCPLVANPAQGDWNYNLIGDACGDPPP